MALSAALLARVAYAGTASIRSFSLPRRSTRRLSLRYPPAVDGPAPLPLPMLPSANRQQSAGSTAHRSSDRSWPSSFSSRSDIGTARRERGEFRGDHRGALVHAPAPPTPARSVSLIASVALACATSVGTQHWLDPGRVWTIFSTVGPLGQLLRRCRRVALQRCELAVAPADRSGPWCVHRAFS